MVMSRPGTICHAANFTCLSDASGAKLTSPATRNTVATTARAIAIMSIAGSLRRTTPAMTIPRASSGATWSRHPAERSRLPLECAPALLPQIHQVHSPGGRRAAGPVHTLCGAQPGSRRFHCASPPQLPPHRATHLRSQRHHVLHLVNRPPVLDCSELLKSNSFLRAGRYNDRFLRSTGGSAGTSRVLSAVIRPVGRRRRFALLYPGQENQRDQHHYGTDPDQGRDARESSHDRDERSDTGTRQQGLFQRCLCRIMVDNVSTLATRRAATSSAQAPTVC